MANEILSLSSFCISTRQNHLIIPNGIQSGKDAIDNEIVENVFGIDMLLEKILTYAIHTDNGDLDLEVVKSIRIVQKSWLSTVAKTLRKVGKPVIKLTLTKNNVQNKKIKTDQGKPLHTFIQTFTPSNGMVQSAIPFKLELTERFFWEENYNSLLVCLTRLGSSLFELEISYPKDGGTLPVYFPNLNLPSLRKFSFKFSDTKVQQDEHDDTVHFGNNIRGMFLLQSILNGAENLKKFVHPFDNLCSVPKDFKFLRLPPNIVDLELKLNLENKDYEVLLEKNNLPNLERLTLLIHKDSLEHDLSYKILDPLQNTLKYFCIYGLTSNGNPRLSTNLRFPIMKRLETINITSELCELSPGEVFSLHECHANLKNFQLKHQKVNTFKKWIENSKSENVDYLEVSLEDEYVEDDSDDNFISADTELIQGMYKAFPNIKKLALTFNVSDLSGLSCIFQNMINLNYLHITLSGNLDEFNSDLFDSKALCLPLPVLKTLREYGHHFQTVKLKRDTSIRNLAELTGLVLWTTTNLEDEEDSLLSEMLVNYGLLQMSKLIYLSLNGKFKPTPEISKLWNDSGRFIVYE